MKKLVLIIVLIFASCKSGDINLKKYYRNSDNDILTLSEDGTFKVQRFSHSFISKGSFVGNWKKNNNEINLHSFLNRDSIPIEIVQKEQNNSILIEINLIKEYIESYKGTVDFYLKSENEEFYLGTLNGKKNIYKYDFDKNDNSFFQIVARYKKDRGLIETTKYDYFQTTVVNFKKNDKLYCKIDFNFDYFDIEIPENNFCRNYQIMRNKLKSIESDNCEWFLK